jgi:hypothetical protein
MSGRATIILALLVVLGAAILVYEGPPAPERPQPQTVLGEPVRVDPTRTTVPLLNFTPAGITQVVLISEGKRLTATRQGDQWPGTRPAGAIADFLNSLAGLGELMRLETGPGALREYGLDPAQAEIELHRSNDEPLVVLLGDNSPASTGTYVRIGRTGHPALAGALIRWEFEKAFRAMGG